MTETALTGVFPADDLLVPLKMSADDAYYYSRNFLDGVHGGAPAAVPGLRHPQENEGHLVERVAGSRLARRDARISGRPALHRH